MLLYIEYIEPLLIYIEQRIVGLRFAAIQPDLDAYCDEVNIMSKDVRDLVVVDEAVRKRNLAYELSEDSESNQSVWSVHHQHPPRARGYLACMSKYQ
jgi:hypothetical protein